jgi:hypothetical protein
MERTPYLTAYTYTHNSSSPLPKELGPQDEQTRTLANHSYFQQAYAPVSNSTFLIFDTVVVHFILQAMPRNTSTSQAFLVIHSKYVSRTLFFGRQADDHVCK